MATNLFYDSVPKKKIIIENETEMIHREIRAKKRNIYVLRTHMKGIFVRT